MKDQIRPMTFTAAIEFLHQLQCFGAKFGLENTRKLAELAGNPHHRLRFIHVAGTNGKGSTCAMLESIYRHAGLRVGLFSSPHLVSFAERIQVNRSPVPEAEVVRWVEEMRQLLELGWGTLSLPAKNSTSAPRPPQSGIQKSETLFEAHPTFFEIVTVM